MCKYCFKYCASLQAFFLGGGIETKEPVSSLCFSHQGDLLLVGYANGTLRLWDVSRRSMSKMMSTEHSEAIVHTLFLGQEAPGARNLRVISGDCKGRLLLHAFSQQMVPLIRRFSVETQVLALMMAILFLFLSSIMFILLKRLLPYF